jgi:hypothetical protein
VRDAGHLLHANLAEWGPETVHHTLTRAQARGSAISYVIHLSYGYSKSPHCKGNRNGTPSAQPFSTRNLQHRLSIYADDVVLFLRPVENELQIILDILRLFGEALVLG